MGFGGPRLDDHSRYPSISLPGMSVPASFWAGKLRGPWHPHLADVAPFQIHPSDPLGQLSRILETDHFALVVPEQEPREWGCRTGRPAGSSGG